MKKFELDDIVLIGRTFEEYCRMFELREIPKDKTLLDAASGVSSFCAEANLKGYNVTAADKIYEFLPSEIEKKCAIDLEIVLEKLQDVKDHYKWDFYKNTGDLEKFRKKAYMKFIADFKEKGNSRYVKTEFPETQFKDHQFAVSLVSHFLFLYDEHLDYEFHKKTISEIIRITSDEIRLFPIVNLRYKRSSFVNKLMEDPEFADYEIKIKKVDYEFLKNGNEMLKIEIK
jgi:hypothetical protein